MDVRDIWFGTSFSARVFRVLLLPLSGLYWLGWQGYLLIYRIGFKRSKQPHQPIVAVGNFTVGGSGKSPTVLHMIEVLSGLGHSVVVGCSGYGSPRSENASMAPEGELNPSEWGDEPAMIRMRQPSIPLVVGRNRVEAARLVAARFLTSVLLMDDGLQHLPLKTNVRIAIDQPSSNRFVLPAGPYREPRDPRRVDVILGDEFRIEYGHLSVSDSSGEPIDLDAIVDSKVNALAAIGAPEQFFESLESNGLVVDRRLALTDHDPLTAGMLLASFELDRPIVVTEKDWVKLQMRIDIGDRIIWIARRDARIEPADRFAAWIDGKIKEVVRP